jgi:hypothetical protein
MDDIFSVYADKFAHKYGWISNLWLYEWETTTSLVVEYSNSIELIPDIQVYHTCPSTYGYAAGYIALHII